MRSPLSPHLKEQPLVEFLQVELPQPSLNDNSGDLDRLARALMQKGFSPLQYNPPSLKNLVGKIRRHNFKVTAVLGFNECHWELIDILSGSSEHAALGFSVDLGTSQLVFYLIDLRDRTILTQVSIANPQIIYGEDILTRILFARQEENLQTLQTLLINTFNQIMQQMVEDRGYSLDNVYALAIAGNTTMSHFLLGLDPTNICKEPYIPAANSFPIHHARDLSFSIQPDALVYVFPNVGSYFGGDLIAGILAAGLHRSKDVSIFVDIGTNAEVVLGNRDWLIACAGAAGPALEGGVVERGMMAAPGAIDRIRIDPDTLDTSYHVLGEEKPVGLCGSGLIDLIAEMFTAGILTIQGKINLNLDSPRIVRTDDGTAYVVAFAPETGDGRDLLISDIDIGIFLKSKAAMYTILTVITNKVGLEFKDLKQFFVAGTFGNYIDPAMAIRIGMIPDLPLETYRGLGNTAGYGAAMVVLDRSLLHDIKRICRQVTYIELNVNMELMNEFRGALFLPHTDPRLFPSVRIPETSLGLASE
ncbi:MAG: ASKHA domain-containing protein [Desulforhabdus sp.]|jgi:uncharacterized 2Fe-2S/4Fe-4S cluster protein (DUF4445 family)|nr:ASKHA domain-containing protein [Desulforhabdus sp.]